jgi:hypothetical protein
MPINSLADLREAVASQTERAYGVDDNQLRANPSEGGVEPGNLIWRDDVIIPPVLELPIVYSTWELQFTLSKTVDICLSEYDNHRPNHQEFGDAFPHCVMMGIESFIPRGDVFGKQQKREYDVILRYWLLYGYYRNGSEIKFENHYTRVEKFINNDLEDYGMDDSEGLIEAQKLIFGSTDTHDFEKAVLHIAQGSQAFTVRF